MDIKTASGYYKRLNAYITSAHSACDIIKKTRMRFMLAMLTAVVILIVSALLAIYFVMSGIQEANNRSRLNSFMGVRMVQVGQTISFTTMLQGTEAPPIHRNTLQGVGLQGAEVNLVLGDVGAHFSMIVNRRGEIYNIVTSVDLADETFVEAANIALRGQSYRRAAFEGRVWQYSITATPMQGGNITLHGEHVTFLPENNNMRWVANELELYQIRFIDITESIQTLRSLALTLLMIGLVLFLMFFLFCLFFSRRAIKPLAEVMEKQKQFVADASHELKTPISIIKANCSALYAGENETILSQKEWLDNIAVGADRMTNLTQSLLTLAKLEDTDNEIIRSEVMLDQEVDELLSFLELAASDKAITIKKDYKIRSPIISDNERIKQVIGIVLDNAIKYTNENGTIQITLSQEKGWKILSVFNTGAGIAKEDLGKIFDRFYRAQKERTHDGSYGLGLSIAQTIMQQLGGFIKAESIMGEGTTFILGFPS